MNIIKRFRERQRYGKNPCIRTKILRTIRLKSQNSFWVIVFLLRAFIGVETAALTFRTKQYSTSYSSHICYGKRFYNDFFLNHNTIALVRNCLKLLSCVVIWTEWKRINYLNSLKPFSQDTKWYPPYTMGASVYTWTMCYTFTAYSPCTHLNVLFSK